MSMFINYRHFDGKSVVACSGGPDSMALLDFLIKKNKVDSILLVNHGYNNEFYLKSLETIIKFCFENHISKTEIPLYTRKITVEKPKHLSLEEFWRYQRIEFYNEIMQLRDCRTVVTGHNLDDLVETWVMSSFNGGSKLMPRKTKLREGINFKPFLHTPKNNLVEWCKKYDVTYVIDPSNEDVNSHFDRVKIRQKLLPIALDIYPGLCQMVRRQSLKAGD